MLANHQNNGAAAEANSIVTGVNDAVLAEFDSFHSEMQIKRDRALIRALGENTLLQSDPTTGMTEKATRYFAPSHTRLEIIRGDGIALYKIAGGWITQIAAQQLVAREKEKQRRAAHQITMIRVVIPEAQQAMYIRHVDPTLAIA